MLDEFEGQLIVVEHHVDDVLEIPWTAQRSSWYSASAKPHVRVDGIYLKMGATSCASAAGYYRAMIEQRLSETAGLSPVEINGGYWLDGDSLRVMASFTLLDDVTLIDAQAHLIITEDDVWESGIHLYHLTRAAQSQDVSLTWVGQTANAPASFYRDPFWNPNRLKCVVCLQRMGDENAEKEIHQTSFLSEGFADVPADPARAFGPRLSLVPNPYAARTRSDLLTIEIRFASKDESRPEMPGQLRIYDALGRPVGQVTTLVPVGSTLRAVWDGCAPDGSPLPTGPYWLRAVTPQGSVSRKVLVLR